MFVREKKTQVLHTETMTRFRLDVSAAACVFSSMTSQTAAKRADYQQSLKFLNDVNICNVTFDQCVTNAKQIRDTTMLHSLG